MTENGPSRNVLAIWMLLMAVTNVLVGVLPAHAGANGQPSILWIVTDDQRADSVGAYNRSVHGQDSSPLGYVESPNADQLASEGVLFTHAITNSPVCAPSRAAMHTGRYPFRTGHYAFELTHQAPDFVKPVVSEVMRDHGYGTASFGKMDHYIYKWGPGQGFHDAGLFDLRFHFKNHLQKNGWGDLFTKMQYGRVDGKPVGIGSTETVIYPSGKKKSYFLQRTSAELTDADRAAWDQVNEEFDLLRAYTRGNKNLIIGGENPRPAGDTIDAYILREFTNYLENADRKYRTLWGQSVSGPDTRKPQFLHLGFHLPHTPVLPPNSFRDRFREHHYDVPEFDQAELSKMPQQLQKIFKSGNMVDLTDEEKQQAIQDYYAFCTYGYSLLDVLGEKRPKRDYVLGEINVISGPRAYLHTKRFRFSMRTRPFSNLVRESQMGKNLQWALNAPPEKVEMALYDLKGDPLERNNLAYQEGYERLAAWFRDKLGRIVLGDGRIECDWSQENAYALGDFAKGADDKKAEIPKHLIP